MTPHTTHFADCGCVTAKNSVLLDANEALEETVRVLRAEVATWQQTCVRLRVEAALVSGALCDAGTVVVDPAHEGVKRLTADRDAAVREADRLRHPVSNRRI